MSSLLFPSSSAMLRHWHVMCKVYFMCTLYRSGINHLAITIHQLHGKLDILLSAEMTLCPIIHIMKSSGPTSYVNSFSKISEPVGMHLKRFSIHFFSFSLKKKICLKFCFWVQEEVIVTIGIANLLVLDWAKVVSYKLRGLIEFIWKKTKWQHYFNIFLYWDKTR